MMDTRGQSAGGLRARLIAATCDLPERLLHPGFLLGLILLVHLAGRIAAFCMYVKLDSFYYAVSAYRLWQGDAAFTDLIPDKPLGQALLTGWVFRLVPASPSRVHLLPVESIFMAGGYAVFWSLSRRLWGGRIASCLTLFFVVAQNTYNGLELITDGFNLAENYLILPMLLAVFAHLLMETPRRRGLVRGLAIGVALSIKQTALGLAAVLLIHGWLRMWRQRSYRQGLHGCAWTLAGVGLAWLPMLMVLVWRGWLGGHVHDLIASSGGHLAWMPVSLPSWYNLSPLLPMFWWVLLGGLAEAAKGRTVPTIMARYPENGVPSFVVLWLVVEMLTLWMMNKPATHYYQQIVAPVTMLAGLAVGHLKEVLAGIQVGQRQVVWRWVAVTTAGLAIFAALPLLAETRKRAVEFDPGDEARAFHRWVEEWSPSDAALYPRRGDP